MNDWLVANLNNPDFSVSDFKDIADMNIDNTLFLKKDLYLKSEYILNNPMFKGNDGLFNRLKFDEYYDTLLKKFQEFTTDNSIPNGLELDVFDTLRTPNSKVKKDNLFIGKGKNPDRLKIGIEGVNVWSAPEMSRSEIAQTLKVFNTATGKYEDYTPNDKALFNGKTDFGLSWIKSLFSDPLVMALYDEDTTDKDGTKHYKGEYKLNDEGTYYYETLNGRSPIGKLVLSALDVLTVDGSNLNKYDFFDSDDIEKSVTGVVAKNVASLIPIFIGGPIGTVYSTALIAREMAKAMPMLYGMTTALFSDSETPKWMNTIAAMGDKFTSGTSDYAKEHSFSVENFGNMIADVALQWGLLKGIANAFNKLKGSNKYMDDALAKAEALYKVKAPTMPELAAAVASDWKNSILGQACLKKYLPAAEKAMKESSLLGRDASLMYMAIVSNSDVYNDMLQAGASKKEAAAVALGSTLGMFAVDKYAGLGELFFDDATENSVKAARKAIKNELLGYTDSKGVKHKGVQEIINTIKVSQDTDANKIVLLIHGAANKVKNLMSNFSDDLKYHTTGFLGKAFGEGLEEVGEEVVTDTAKSIYELAGYLGANTSVKDVGAWDNMLERYTMSFLGGVLGGGIFYGVDVMQNGKYKVDKTDEELVTLIRNGHVNELRNEVEKLRKKGKLGSTKLSASNWESTTDGNNVWLTTNDEADSLNLKIADIINLKITSLDSVINNNLVGLSDDALFKNMVLGEQRYYMYLDVAPITDYYEDFNEVLSNLIKAELDYKIASLTLDGSTEITEDNRITDEKLRHLTADLLKIRQEALDKLLLKVNEARLAKDDFLSGDTSMDYMRKLNFALDPVLHAPFLAVDAELLWKETYDKPISKATPEEKLKFATLILPEALKFKTKELVTKSWERFKAIEQTMLPEFHNFIDNAPTYKSWFNDFEKILPSLNSEDLFNGYLNYEDKLDTETDDEYEHRDTKYVDESTGVEESDIDFNNRRVARAEQIKLLNLLKDQEWADNLEKLLAVINFLLDPLTRDLILIQVLPYRTKDVLKKQIEWSGIKDSSILGILSKLTPDLNNIDEVKNLVSTYIGVNSLSTIKENISKDLLKDLTVDRKTAKGTLISSDDIFNWADEIDIHTPTINEVLNNVDIFTEEDGKFLHSLDILSKDDIDTLNKLKDIFGGDMVVQNIIDGNYDVSNISTGYLNSLNSPILNEIDKIATNVKTNPIVKLSSKLKTTIKNPVVEFAKALVGKVIDKETVPDVFKVLDAVQDKFTNIDDVSELLLDAHQLKNLKTAKDALLLASTFIYAASSSPKGDTIIGHNKVLNEYAEIHADRVLHWETLPEIDDDYALIYLYGLNQLSSIIDHWILLSSNNEINKQRLFIETDKAFIKSYNTLYTDNKDKFKLIVNGKDYDLLNGFVNDDSPEVNLYNFEKALYFNFLQALADSKLSVTDFLEQSKFLDKLIDFDTILDQNVSKLNLNLEYNALTEYDKLKYISTILSVDPTDFYNNLKSLVKEDSDKAPIMSQEYASRVIIARTTQTDRDIMNYAFSKTDAYEHNNSNTVVCVGDAGSGKTSVVVKSAINYLPKDTKVLCVGPTDTLALGLQNSLGKGKQMNLETLLRKLFGDTVYNEIQNDLNILYLKQQQKLKTESKYFGMDGGFPNIKSGSVTFLALDEVPNVIVIDEATHVPAVMLQFLDAYTQANNGTLILLGDTKQRGYINNKSGVGNIDLVSFFSARTPELNVSLRDNNILKQSNLSKVKALLNTVLYNYDNMSEDDYFKWLVTLEPLIHKLKFRAYTNDSVAGDLIVPTLTPEIITNIKSSNNIGFIGNTSSAAYQALKNAGIDATVLSMDEMQGLEFDYVVVDHDFKAPKIDRKELYHHVSFLQDLYTLMSRGKTAAIFIDNGLSSIIGKNTIDDYTAKAPSLTDKINGQSAVELLKKSKLEVLNKFDLTKPTITPSSTSTTTAGSTSTTTSTSTTSSTPGPASTTTSTPSATSTSSLSATPEDFHNPDEGIIDPETKKVVDEMADEDKKNPKPKSEAKFTAMSFGDVTYLGVTIEEKTLVGTNGKKYTANEWSFGETKGALRNLSAIYHGGPIFWYKDKMKLQKELNYIKSMLIFGHAWEEDGEVLASTAMQENFTLKEWEKGLFKLEMRTADNEVLPLFSSMPEIGMDYKGERLIANIIFEVKDKKGNICKFDIAGINDPNTLLSKKEEHKRNLETWIKAAKTAEEKDRLTSILNSVDEQADKYVNLIERVYNAYKKSSDIAVPIDAAIVRRNHVWFTDRKSKGRAENIRLGGRIDPDNIGVESNDYKDLMDEASNFVFSKIYTFADKGPTSVLGIDMSLKGRAVIFVSSDMTMKPDALILQYINQKEDPEHYAPTVRMITLDNYGMTFNLMTSDTFTKRIQGGDVSRLPYRANYVGLSMFVSMWNWRASLYLFRRALDNWMDEHSYDKEKVKAITKAANEIYRKGTSEKASILANNHVTEEDLKNLKDFNEINCKDIRFFRLGLSDKNGFHIQLFDVDTASYVDKKKGKLHNANFIVIDPDKAEQFDTLITRIFRAIEPNSIGVPTLGLNLTKPTGESWSAVETIDLEDAAVQGSLSRLITPELNIQYNGVNVAYKLGEFWSALPKLLSSVVRTLEHFQFNPEDKEKWSGSALVYVSKSGTDLSLSLLLKDLLEHKVLKDTTDNPVAEGDHPDRSLRDMFDLMFHGTTDNIRNKKALKVTGVRFPNGFYINPDIARNKVSATSNDIEHVEYAGKAVFYPVSTNPALFTANVKLIAAGLDMDIDTLGKSIQEFFDGKKPSTPATTTTVTIAPTVEVTPTVTTEEEKVFNKLCESYKCPSDETPEDKVNFINTKINNTLAILILNGEDIDTLYHWEVIAGKLIRKPILEIIREESGNANPEIEYSDGKVTVDGKEFDTTTLKFVKTDNPVTNALDMDYKGLKVGELLNKYIYSKEFENAVEADEWCDSDGLEEFKKSYATIYNNRDTYENKEDLKIALEELDSDYTSLLDRLYDNIFNELMLKC